MNLGNWLARQARMHPKRPALYLGQDCVADYGSFHHKASCVAGWLRSNGVGPGDRVAIFMKNCPDYLIVFYGAWYVGASVVPINAKLHSKEAVFILENAGASFVFVSSELADDLRSVGAPCPVLEVGSADYDDVQNAPPVDHVEHVALDALAWLFYTSGTTGKPKGVRITHRMLMTMTMAYLSDVDEVTADDATLYAAPMSHGAGIYNMLHVLKGARHVCPVSGGFDEREIFDLSAHFGRVHMFAAPTMVTRMTAVAKAAGLSGDGLRTIIYAGGPMYLADIVEAVEHFGSIFVQIYGQGECPMGITVLTRKDVADRSHPRWRERLTSVGQAQSPVDVQIGTTDGDVLPAGTHGEIMVRGDIVMPGYWENPEATEKTLINGWLMTGDMGVMDGDGYVTMRDRSKDMIISGGSNIYPREVEEVLLMHPELSEVSVVGRPHPDWGEEVVAFIVGEADEADLDRLCSEEIARFKRPKAYIRVEGLPKNNYGKVLKTELRARFSPKS